MPLTAELFELCVARIQMLGLETAHEVDLLAAYGRFQKDVETWLTWLASDQPWLTEASIFRNRAAFADVSRGLASVILSSQNSTFTAHGGASPPWLYNLVDRWANNDAAVISFNYDALVERTYEDVLQGSTSVILYSFMPEALDGAARLGGVRPSHRFSLYKLHGSITWYVFPGEGRYGPIYDAGFATGWEGPDDEAALLLRVGARQPLIVPPVVSKEPFFGRPELRDQWMRADHRLQEADRLFLLGYSLPEADLTARFLLNRVDSRCEVITVNTDDAVRVRVERLLQSHRVNPDFSGRPEVITEFATAYAGGTAM